MIREFISRERLALGAALFGSVALLSACSDNNDSKHEPTISFTVAPDSIATGESALLSWTTTDATTCAASGAWSGEVPTSSTGVSTGVVATAGTYTYTLTCEGEDGTATADATLTVTGPAATGADCGIGIAPTAALLATDGATVTTDRAAGVLCVDCEIADPDNVITKDPAQSLLASYAEIKTPLSLLNNFQSLSVTGVPAGGTFAAGGPAGFLIAAGSPSGLLSQDVAKGLVVQTLNHGTVVDTVTSSQTTFLGFTTASGSNAEDPLTLELLGADFSLAAVGDNAYFVGIPATTAPYDEIRLISADTLSLFSTLKVYAACVQP